MMILIQILSLSSQSVSELYVINKGRDYIGLTTQVGLTTAGNGLFFYSTGSDNSEYKSHNYF